MSPRLIATLARLSRPAAIRRAADCVADCVVVSAHRGRAAEADVSRPTRPDLPSTVRRPVTDARA